MADDWWRTCSKPQEMLAGLCGSGMGDRKFRLFAVALARRVWGKVHSEAIRRAVEVAERHADRQATDSELETAFRAVEALWMPPIRANRIAVYSADPNDSLGAIRAAKHAAYTGLRRAGVVALLREVFGDEQYLHSPLNVSWLTREVRGLAVAAYEEREMPAGTLFPERLAVLSDALEEAGRDDAALLSHLRSAGPHVRGCWALDLALGRRAQL